MYVARPSLRSVPLRAVEVDVFALRVRPSCSTKTLLMAFPTPSIEKFNLGDAFDAERPTLIGTLQRLGNQCESHDRLEIRRLLDFSQVCAVIDAGSGILLYFGQSRVSASSFPGGTTGVRCERFSGWATGV